MKNLAFDLDSYQIAKLFQPFRKKSNIILFWMEAVKLAASHVPPSPDDRVGKMLVRFDKMRRVIVHSRDLDKAFSASFPFSISEVGGTNVFHLNSGVEINSRISSEVISVLTSARSFENDEVIGFLDDLEQSSSDPDTLWKVLSELVQTDDGYVRLDHDPKREDGALHPLDHIDVFYSQSATFKLGLRQKYDVDQLFDVLDRKSDCRFLEDT